MAQANIAFSKEILNKQKATNYFPFLEAYNYFISLQIWTYFIFNTW